MSSSGLGPSHCLGPSNFSPSSKMCPCIHASLFLLTLLQFPGWFSARALPTSYPSALGSVSAVMKRFLEGGFTLPPPLQPLCSSGHTRENCLGQQVPERGAMLSCVSALFGSWLQCHSLCPVLGTKQGNKDHSQNLHIFPEGIEKPLELSAPKKTRSNLSWAKGKPAQSRGAHKLLDMFPVLFKASRWGT